MHQNMRVVKIVDEYRVAIYTPRGDFPPAADHSLRVVTRIVDPDTGDELGYLPVVKLSTTMRIGVNCIIAETLIGGTNALRAKRISGQTPEVIVNIGDIVVTDRYYVENLA